MDTPDIKNGNGNSIRVPLEPFPGSPGDRRVLGTFLGLSWNFHRDLTPWNCREGMGQGKAGPERGRVRAPGDAPDGCLRVAAATGEPG